MSADDVDTVLRYPNAAIASDGWVLDTDGGGHPHPRNFGTFARAVGQYVTRRQVLGLEDAVRKMTSLPAGRIGLTTRGTLAVDNHADVAVFDPLRFVDAATYDDPKRYAAGIRHVLVNGAVAVADGVVSTARSGRVLRRTAAV